MIYISWSLSNNHQRGEWIKEIFRFLHIADLIKDGHDIEFCVFLRVKIFWVHFRVQGQQCSTTIQAFNLDWFRFHEVIYSLDFIWYILTHAIWCPSTQTFTSSILNIIIIIIICIHFFIMVFFIKTKMSLFYISLMWINFDPYEIINYDKDIKCNCNIIFNVFLNPVFW